MVEDGRAPTTRLGLRDPLRAVVPWREMSPTVPTVDPRAHRRLVDRSHLYGPGPAGRWSMSLRHPPAEPDASFEPRRRAVSAISTIERSTSMLTPYSRAAYSAVIF